MSVDWHKHYEVKFASCIRPWTLQEDFYPSVRAAFVRYLIPEDETDYGKVWLKVAELHEANKVDFEHPAKLIAYIGRIASSVACDIHRERTQAAKRSWAGEIEELADIDSIKRSAHAEAKLLQLGSLISEELTQVELPDAIETIKTRLEAHGNPPAPVDSPKVLNRGQFLSENWIEMRIRLLHWYGADKMILAYYLHLSGYQNKHIAELLKVSRSSVTRQLQQANELFDLATIKLLDRFGGVDE
jgi:hypothetical protein